MTLRSGLVLVLLLIPMPGFAQGLTSFGAKIGVNFARLNSDQDIVDQLDTKTGLVAGGFVELGITDMFSIQPEVLYSQKGGKGGVTDITGAFDATAMLDYIEIPILAKFNFGPSGGVRPFVFTGPVPAFNTRARFKTEVGGTEVTTDIDEDVKGGDFGWVFGGGFKFRGFSVDARYNWGLVNIDEDENEDSIKNQVFSILVGFGWGRL
jgi:hypothetical protein